MYWDDYGYLLSKNKFSENSVIAEIFTENHGKVSGIIYGASSKKIRNYLQIGNKLHVNYNFKNENKLGYLKVEIDQIMSPQFFDDRKKLSSILSSISLVKCLTVENQSNSNIFFLLNNFYDFLGSKKWLVNLIFWELNLLKVIGYDLELKKIVNEEIIDGKKLFFVSEKNNKRYVPNFLVENNINEESFDKVLNGFKLVSDYMDKSIFKPNNIPHPKSRIEFLNLLKE